MLAALLASTLLASLAIVHHVWIDPALGRAIRSLNWPTVEQALGRLWMHEILLTVNGPLLALASWFLLRWMDGPMARRQHRPGSFVRAR